MLGAEEGEKIQSLPSVGQTAHQYNNACWGGGGRQVGGFIGLLCSFCQKNMLSSGLKDFVVHSLSVRSRRWMVICKTGISHWTVNFRVLDGDPRRAPRHGTYMPVSSLKNAIQFSHPCLRIHFFCHVDSFICST